jgi:hypothetical protein
MQTLAGENNELRQIVQELEGDKEVQILKKSAELKHEINTIKHEFEQHTNQTNKYTHDLEVKLENISKNKGKIEAKFNEVKTFLHDKSNELI